MSHLKKVRLGHAVPQQHKKRGDSCASGGFYLNPTAGQTVSSSDAFAISWNTTCMSTKAVDIYLYAPGAEKSLIYRWETVDFASGSYQTTLKPKWWNSTSSVNLQLSIVQAGTMPFMADLPAGPIFSATYTAPSGATPANADTSVPESGVQVVNNVETHHGLSGGKIAAAVIIPLLVVIGLAVAAYIKFSRKKSKEATNRFSQAIDKRMSVLAPEWSSVSAAGAQAAIRQSMAVGESGNRASSFSFGNIRPDSTVALEGGQAGIGTRGLMANKSGIDLTTPQMTQLRSGPRPTVSTGERVSRVSFAADTRPSGESRRSAYSSRTSRAFHVGHVPPLPTRQDSGELMSPTQRAGPLTLSVEDINARLSGLEPAARPSVDEVMPALSMMRTGNKSSDDLLLPPKAETPPPLPSPPPRAHQPQTPTSAHMSMQPMPANVMSPDEMLRAYAERRAMASPPPTVAAPAAVHYDGNAMRTLYSPTTPNSGAMLMSPAVTLVDRRSAAPSEWSKYDDDNDTAYVQ
ncbi:hypothetical protein BDY19DRAFT_895468 [Irpex rosettiformis]|uniref:Uncharacterized protein n=1 Tax=Irpex rosettiformis TaxID=378272 RepID=A0ACB8TVN1_9APHY|nr:hypothetical protein BDY19DRAFT_895468 [Irpex rosettiformis]